ncbi:MAG: ABC transporter permease [Candidatus Marinimicrobia bacterium]|nr:ABC transporter permease [Candidatus Neomarinimicrobiota bacterium]MBT6870193.1 ABC transporter permease [Candidatus Neomarinimicrobiota bacterium]
MSKIFNTLLKDRPSQLGLILLFILLITASLSGFINTENIQSLDHRLLPSGESKHLLGTDHFGRDILLRIVVGAGISLKVGLLASSISLIMGILLGLIAGYFGKWVDTLIMRITDIMMAFPVLLFLIAISATFEPGINTAMIAIGAVSWPPMARLMRSQVLMLKSREFISSAEALGFSHSRILFFHILPNCLAPIIVTFTLGISGAIMAEASLSFLGLGVQPPTPSWGSMINEGKDFLRIAPGISVYPGIAIAITVLAFNLVGEGLRDALDVKLEK